MNTIKLGLAVVVSVVALSGCINREGRTSGIIGCPPNELKISDEQTQFNTITWQATCRGKSFYCTGDSGGGTTCAPLLEPQ